MMDPKIKSWHDSVLWRGLAGLWLLTKDRRGPRDARA